MKKLIILILTVLLIFSAFSIYSLGIFADVAIKSVDISPSNIGSIAQYTFYIVLSKDLNIGENLYIKFPSSCTVPQSISKDLVSIATNKPSNIAVQSNIVILTLSYPLFQNQGGGTGGVAVVFSSSIGIINPSSPDVYTVEIWTTNDPAHSVYSFYIGLSSEGSMVTAVSASLNDYNAGKNSGYDILFKTTFSGALIQGDYIDVYFPKGTVLPATPDLNKVFINLGSPSSIVLQDRKLRLYLPANGFVAPGGSCAISFLPEFGIINPEFTGSFAIQVTTSRDTGLATSNFYTLYGTSIQSLVITAVPSSQKMNSEYKIEVRNSQTTGALIHDKSKINIKFADAFGMPQLIKPGAITVNDTPCTNVSISDNIITLVCPIDIPSNSNFTVLIKKEFGVIIPDIVGIYEVFVNTSTDAVFVSTTISITPSTISVPTVQLSNSSSGQLSTYSITFSTGVSGALLPGIDKINVVFPVGTTIPQSIPNSTILVNDIPTTLNEISGTTDTITVPTEVKSNSIVRITISDNSGIKNPVNPGPYSLKIFTSKEQTPINSNSYNIISVPQTVVHISPAGPDGLNGFYKTAPSIAFAASSSIDPNPTIYYYIDANQVRTYENKAIFAPEGFHTIYYYSVDKDGHKEDTKSLQVKVDSIPPIINVISPLNNAILNSSNASVKGTVDPGSTVKINGEMVQVDSAGNFETTVKLQNNPDMINIFATDIAGNTSNVTITVSIDTIPPNLTITKPVMFEQVSKLPLLVEGVTEKVAVVTVNGINADVKPDGTFSASLSTLPEGTLTNIEVIATDAAGNSTKRSVSVKYIKSIRIILQVGNKIALINNVNATLEAAPVITVGRTMVPLRFVGEAFGAEFTYDSVFKIIDITLGSDKIKMQVGKNSAFVNGKEITLDVAPYIVNGRTLVPIRFISEAFGADVVWDSNTKTVTIIYPKT